MIDIQGLNKSFKNKKVLTDINCQIQPGEITGLIGHNGAGKSTLINCLAGLIPYQGEITVNQVPIEKSKGRIVHVNDSLNLPFSMTIKECKDFMQHFYPNWNQKRAIEIQKFFELDNQTKIKELSKGNQAKLNLMLGLSIDADYLILDEPFAAIDVFSREKILELFGHFIQEQCGVLVSTHELYDVEVFIDRALMMENGKIIRSEYLEDLRASTGQSLVEWVREEIHSCKI